HRALSEHKTLSISWSHYLMYDMNFSSIVADEYGIPRQLNENSFAITTSLAASEIEDLIRLKCLDLPGNDSNLLIVFYVQIMPD
uniref:type V toxin-antitoxin system endoribonuclease antitoxin GhoS n=1 Tax=Escherichia coli TaxID=562 RepID=UPI001CDAF889